MSTIAKLNIDLVARVASLGKGLSRGQKMLRRFQRSVFSVQGALAGLGLSISAAAMAHFVRRQMQSIDAAAKHARALGLSTNELQAFRHAAELGGAGAAVMDMAMQRMVRRVGTAAARGGPVADVLESIGLQANNLANMRTADMFGSIADAIRRIENPAQRVAAAYAIFDQQGVRLMDTLMGGSEATQQIQADMERLGIAISDVDAAQIESANDSIARLKFAISGVGRRIAVELSPFIDAAASRLMEMGRQGEGATSRIENGMRNAARSAAIVADVVHTLRIGFTALQYAVTRMMQGVVWAIEKVAEGIVYVANLIPGVDMQVSAFLRNLRTEMGATATALRHDLHDMFLADPPSVAIMRGFDEIREAARRAAEQTVAARDEMGNFSDAADGSAEAIGRIISQLQQQIDTFGKSRSATQLYQLEQMGASDEVIALAASLAKQIDELERQADAQREAARLFDSTRTSMERYESQISNLNDLLEAGAIDWDLYTRGVQQARDALEGTADAMRMAASPTFAAQESRFLTRGSSSTADPQTRMASDMRGILDENRKQTREATASRRALDELTRTGAVIRIGEF